MKRLRALVCGASDGIGLASAKALASSGKSVCLLARREDRLATALASLDPSIGHSIVVCDLADRASLRDKVAAEIEKRGPFQILVGNAGGPQGGPLLGASSDAFLDAFSRHLLSQSLLVELLHPGMRGFGRVIQIISTSVKTPLYGLGVSNTIRGAVASWAKTLANELGPEGITVNSVLPGFTNTQRLNELLLAKAQKEGKSTDAVRREWEATVPLRRIAEPDEIASVVNFLASEGASYVNGVAIAVDGGRTPCL